MRQKLYLKAGDRVKHRKYLRWGEGEVVEERHSQLVGGFCMVRVLFDDGNERCFINDLNHQCCCYYSGLRLI